MTKVYTLTEFIDGDVNVSVYGTLEAALGQAEELASLCDFEESHKHYWTDPADTGDYIEVQAKELL
jgi:hypothetical protein